MTSSRSGTALHKRMRERTLTRDRNQPTCPICGRWLNWDTHGHPDSPEADEIIPYAINRQTSENLDDWQTICRHCNQSKGGRLGNRRHPRHHREPGLVTSRDW